MKAPNKVADGFIDASILEVKRKISKELMEEDLAKSGLEDSDLYAEARSLPSLWCPRGDLAVGCYRIPYFDQSGAQLEHMWRERVFYKAGAPADLPKYVQPNKEELARHEVLACMPYLYPHGVASLGVFICEGEKKTAKVADHFGVRAIGIGGKDMWHHPDVHPKVLHPELVKALAAGGDIVILADPDINEKEQVKKSYAGLLLRLKAQYPDRSVRIIATPEKVDDWLVGGAADIELDELLQLEDVPGMDTALSMTDLAKHYKLLTISKINPAGVAVVTGIYVNEHNVMKLLSAHPKHKDSLRYNEDAAKLEVFGQPIQNNLQDAGILEGLQWDMYMPKLTLRVCQTAIKHVAMKNSYSPAMEDILACGEWDGEEWFEKIFSEELAPVMRALVCGYVKRVMDPGCDWRIMVILAGPQKVGKTGCARWVTGSKERVYDFHAGQMDGKDKDILKRLMRPGISLFDDIDTFGRTEKGRLKAIITQQSTTLRGAYKEHDETLLRRGVMMGTTNDPQIIPDDPTGNTRFVVGMVPALLPFDLMIKHRPAIIACARGLLADGYAAEDIDFVEMTAKYTEEAAITEQLREFVDDLRSGAIKVNSVDVFSKDGVVYFKASRFWQQVNGRADYKPKDWERKELGLRARALGLVWHDSSHGVRFKAGVNVKNLWRL